MRYRKQSKTTHKLAENSRSSPCVLLPLATIGLLALVFLSACSTSTIERAVTKLGLNSTVIIGKPFRHQVFRNKKNKQTAGKLLHVYIEGDGRPWRNRHTVSLDPTPKNLLMLELMAVDPAPSIYLGRPCYFNLEDANCSPEWWTDKRYSRAVVVSLNQVIQELGENYTGIVLFGHSGGGTLAMLLAGMRSDVVEVVTLAGNLDIDAWARRHRYSYLRGSINPAQQPALNDAIVQRHYLGELDRNITADMLQPTLSRQPAAQFFLVKGVGHSCCWQRLWPELLSGLRN